MTPQLLSVIQLRFDGDTRARAIGVCSLILAVGVAAGKVRGGQVVGAHLPAAALRPALLLNVPTGVALLLNVPTGVALLALAGFVALARRVQARGGDPLFDLDVLRLPDAAAGAAAVMLVMGAYAGFLLSLTLHLQGGLGFTPLGAGQTYATGFATTSFSWTRLRPAVRAGLPALGPLVMSASLLTVGLVASRAGVYLGAAPSGSAHALSVTTEVPAPALVVTTVFAPGAPAAARTAGAPIRAMTT